MSCLEPISKLRVIARSGRKAKNVGNWGTCRSPPQRSLFEKGTGIGEGFCFAELFLLPVISSALHRVAAFESRSAEQVGMGPRADELYLLSEVAVYEQPIRFNMTFPAALPFAAAKRVIALGWRQRPAGNRQVENLRQFLLMLAAVIWSRINHCKKRLTRRQWRDALIRTFTIFCTTG